MGTARSRGRFQAGLQPLILSPGRSHLWGRRKGRPLHVRKSSLMRELLPLVEIVLPGRVLPRPTVLSQEAESTLAPPDKTVLDPNSLFEKKLTALVLEIGFGGGEHVAGLAGQNPDTGFIGCEPFVNGVASLLEHIDDGQLRNVRVFPNDARLLLDALPNGAIDKCFVLYPDPWPKKRHIERRFVSQENLSLIARVLKPGATLQLATDVAPLAAWMHEQASAHAAFTCIYQSDYPPPEWLATRYEEKGIAAGRVPAYMIYRRD